jgi:hypothetical protein
MAAHPRQQRDVVHDRALGLVQPQAFAKPQRQHRLPQHMLHRLTQTEVNSQRQRRDQLRKTDTRIPLTDAHRASVDGGTGAARPRICPGVSC